MAWHDKPNSSRPLLVLTTLLLIWSTLFATIRVWTKWQQQRSWLDLTFAASYILAIAQCTTIFLATAHYGFGEDEFNTPDNASPSSWKKSLFAGEILYIIVMGILRSGTAMFMSQLSRQRPQNLVGYILAALSASWMVSSVFTIALRGDMAAPWLTVGPNWTRWLAIETVGLVLEVSFWAFAVSLIIGLQMAVFKKIKIVLIFGTRLLLIPFVTYRLIRLSPSVYHGSVYDITMVNIFTQLAMHFALFAECLTTLKPFMQTFHEGYAVENTTHYWGGLSITSPQHGSASNGYMIDSSGKRKGFKVKSKEVPSWRQRSNDDTRLNRSGFSTKIESSRRTDRSKDGGEDDIELLSSNNIWVQQTTNVSSTK